MVSKALRTRCLLILLAALLPALLASAAEEPAPPPGQDIVYAVTTMGKVPVTAIYALEIGTGMRRLLYRDTEDASRVILKQGSSDILGAGRATPVKDVYVIVGPPVAPDNPAHLDAISRLRFPDETGKQAAPEPVLPLPLSFSESSAYHLWNRAPVFAVSSDGGKFAVFVLRIGETRLERPAIRIIPIAGEEWRVPLPDSGLYIADLAFSPDAKLLAYSVMPQGDEHTLDEAHLPIAGLYLADLSARTTRMLYAGFIDAVAWGPKPDQITVAARVGDFWSTKHVGAVISISSGQKLREFSLRGPVVALAYSEDAQWLAAETVGGGQRIWVYPVAGGWGRQAPVSTETGGRISLLGWVRIAALGGAASPGAERPGM